VRRCERADRPVIFYLHPWELDPDHPRLDFYWKARLTHYVNLRSTAPKLSQLLRDFRFGTIHDVIASEFIGRAHPAAGLTRETR
jgi:hypothetical protein